MPKILYVIAVTADKAYDCEKVRQQIKDEGALPVIRSCGNAARKDDAQNRKLVLPHQGRAARCQPATTNSPEISLPPLPSSVHSTGSSCESDPSFCPLLGVKFD